MLFGIAVMALAALFVVVCLTYVGDEREECENDWIDRVDPDDENSWMVGG